VVAGMDRRPGLFGTTTGATSGDTATSAPSTSSTASAGLALAGRSMRRSSRFPERLWARRLVTPRFVRDAARHGACPSTSGPSTTPPPWRGSSSWGVDGLITDRPDRGARVLAERAGRPLPPGSADVSGPGRRPRAWLRRVTWRPGAGLVGPGDARRAWRCRAGSTRWSCSTSSASHSGTWVRLTAAHLDHAMRPGSAADARWVRALPRLGGAVTSERARARRPLRGRSPPRPLRVSPRVGPPAPWIATGHHLDDQAETVLFRAPGHGAPGAAGDRAAAGPGRPPPPPVPAPELEAYAAAVPARVPRGPDERDLATPGTDPPRGPPGPGAARPGAAGSWPRWPRGPRRAEARLGRRCWTGSRRPRVESGTPTGLTLARARPPLLSSAPASPPAAPPPAPLWDHARTGRNPGGVGVY
jgi:hypothetical protein